MYTLEDDTNQVVHTRDTQQSFMKQLRAQTRWVYVCLLFVGAWEK